MQVHRTSPVTSKLRLCEKPEGPVQKTGRQKAAEIYNSGIRTRDFRKKRHPGLFHHHQLIEA
jgi:hypothetical protein